MAMNVSLHEIGFVHIGLAKTGSTYLQKAVFPSQERFVMIGSHGKHPELKEHVERIWREEVGQMEMREWCRNWQEVFGGLLKNAGLAEAKIGISNERLAGHFITGHGRYSIADKLRLLFGDVRIIIVLREPLAYLQSAYNQMVKQGVSQPLAFVLDDRINFPGRHLRDRLDYQSLVRYYRRVFSEDRVLVLPLEMMAEEERRFIQLLASFLETDELRNDRICTESQGVKPYGLRNPSFTGLALSLQRLCNYLGVPKQKSRRLLARFDVKIFTRVSPYLRLKKTSNVMKSFAAVHDLLHDIDYNCWSGDLARFNYKIPNMSAGSSSSANS